jgi:NitT/TauT family transport system ATP-binding protein
MDLGAYMTETDLPVALTFDCVSKTYDARNRHVAALQEVSFTAHAVEFVCIVGPSGCGKTTLLKLIAGLLEPSAGDIAFNNQPPGDRPHCILVFQERGLFPWMSVLDNAAFGLEMMGIGQRERHARARAFIERVGLAAFAHSYPHELSVGMRQRVAIARAFVTDPDILLMDEPFGALDAQTRLVLQEELLHVWKEQRRLILYVTHDIDEAVMLGDRVLVLSGRPGRIMQDLPVPLERPRDLLNREDPIIAKMRWQIWQTLRDEVHKSLYVPE